MPCARMVDHGSRFCARHARAIEGAVLGALMHAEVCDQAEVQRTKEERVFNTEGTEFRTQSSQRRSEGKKKRRM